MKRMKTFLIYGLLIAALWIFSDIVIYFSINGTYKSKETRINVSSVEVTITENKATYINGVVKGNIKNNTEKIIDGTYLKIDMYSPRNVNLGTKYVEINNLKPNQVREFEMGYKFTDVSYVTITTTNDVQNASTEEFKSDAGNLYFLFGTLLFLYLI